ncbi:MAG: RNA methyltransferase [Firmicutes bacterium]|nr:RNA methyltransferase [Bacillota bacterium]
MHRVSSPDNPFIKELVRLHDRRGREEAGEVLLEGPHLLAEALKAEQEIHRVFYLPEWAGSSEGRALLGMAERAGAGLVETGRRAMAKAATTETPPPVLATARLRPRPPEEETSGAGLVLDGLQDPGNVGTILRAAWGAGAGIVWATPGTVDFYAPKVMRAAQGAHFHLRLAEGAAEEILAFARRGGWWLAAAEARAGTPFWRAKMRRPCLICIGNEARGLSASFLRAADERVSIPLAAGVDSLNAALCAGILLFELARRTAGT